MKRGRGKGKGYLRAVEYPAETVGSEVELLSGQPLIPLSNLPPGARAVVMEIRAGRGLTRRLMEMGLLPGSEITVLSNSAGPLLVSVRGVTLSLGRGIASKIFVQLA